MSTPGPTWQKPPEVAARDEVFWQAQETRKRGQLGQPCCTQQNMSWALMDLPGDFAVVVHGEFDCLNCFHHHTGPSAHQFYSTRLSDHALTTGGTQQPLEHLLRLIIRDRHPSAIVVLGTCPVEVIGDRFERVTDRVQADTGTPILALHTSGLKLSSLTACQDWLFEALASLPTVPPVDAAFVERARMFALGAALTTGPLDTARTEALAEAARTLGVPVAATSRTGRVNLLGLPDAHPEPTVVLGALGLTVNGFYPRGATFETWRAIGMAEVTAAVDATVFPKLTERLKQQHAQDVVEVSLPVGLAATLSFYRSIAARFDRAAELESKLAARVADAEASLARFREQHGGTRLGMAIRMLNTHELDRFVHDGLGDLPHLQECGFDVTLLVQGPPEEGPRFEARLRARGVDVPVVPFAGPFELGDKLAQGGFHVAYVPDSSRNAARRAGVPMIASRALRPWLSGLDHNLATLGALAREGHALRGGAA